MPDRSPDGAWFTAKRYGYGAGLPIAWQGWLLLAGYLAVLSGLLWLPYLHGNRPTPGTVLLIGVLTAGFLELARRRTRGGWKWRWGEDQ